MSEPNSEDVRLAALHSSYPLVLRGFVRDWDLCSKSLEEWSCIFGDRKIPWRTAPRSRLSDEPCWERACSHRELTFESFLKAAKDSNEWLYFDYKHLKQCFSSESEIPKKVSWSKFGFPEKNGSDSTVWVGSRGAHTPTHQDTYGSNIVAQLYGTKRWVMFPPETGGLRPTRAPYEESSVYSELNFCCPRDLEPFRGLTGARSVVLEAGDALVLPRGWWHYVQHDSEVAITVNIWLPHETDGSSRVSEALVRILVAQLCKDLPPETTRLLLNPNEDDLADTPLAVLFLQLDTVTQAQCEEHRKLRRLKRQKTTDETTNSESASFDLNKFLTNQNVGLVPRITSDQLIDMLKENIRTLVHSDSTDDVDGDLMTSKLRLTRAVINAFCQNNVIESVKENLFRNLCS